MSFKKKELIPFFYQIVFNSNFVFVSRYICLFNLFSKKSKLKTHKMIKSIACLLVLTGKHAVESSFHSIMSFLSDSYV